MEEEKKLIYISFNDWDHTFETPKCKEFMNHKNRPKDKDLPFSYDVGLYDQAAVFVITTTKEDLEANGYGEFLKYEIDPETDDGLWRDADFFLDEGVESPWPDYKYSLKTKFAEDE